MSRVLQVALAVWGRVAGQPMEPESCPCYGCLWCPMEQLAYLVVPAVAAGWVDVSPAGQLRSTLSLHPHGSIKQKKKSSSSIWMGGNFLWLLTCARTLQICVPRPPIPGETNWYNTSYFYVLPHPLYKVSRITLKWEGRIEGVIYRARGTRANAGEVGNGPLRIVEKEGKLRVGCKPHW